MPQDKTLYALEHWADDGGLDTQPDVMDDDPEVPEPQPSGEVV